VVEAADDERIVVVVVVAVVAVDEGECVGCCRWGRMDRRSSWMMKLGQSMQREDCFQWVT